MGEGVAVHPVRSELLLELCGGIVAVPFEPSERLTVGLAYQATDENPALRVRPCGHGVRGALMIKLDVAVPA